MRAQVVRALQLAAVAAFVEGFDLQGIVRTANAPAMRRYFSLGDSHCGTCSLSLNPKFRGPPLSQAPCPRKRGGGSQPCGEGAPYSDFSFARKGSARGEFRAKPVLSPSKEREGARRCRPTAKRLSSGSHEDTKMARFIRSQAQHLRVFV
jgi:hypothetical protein